MEVDDLNKCLRGELSAIETYRQALDKNRQQYANDAKFQQLTQMLRDHQQAAEQLRDYITRMGGTPSTDSGAWGAWSQTVMGTAKLFGDKAALKALKEGEESGLKDYRDLLDTSSVPGDVRNLASSLMSRKQQHVQEIDRLMNTV
jgi:bacterioferritin (cytochrome b1)